MKKCFIINSVIFIITQLILFPNISSQLTRFAFTFSSSGTRNPSNLSPYNKDIFGKSWLSGHSALTPVGKRQQFLLGRYIRTKYSQLISDDYEPHEVFISATNDNHTIQSAYAQIRGLYPSSPELTPIQLKNAVPPNCSLNISSLNNKTLPDDIMIIPVHTFYEKDHSFELYKVSNCPNIQNDLDKIYNNNNTKQLITNITNVHHNTIEILISTSEMNVTYTQIVNNVSLFEVFVDTVISSYKNGYFNNNTEYEMLYRSCLTFRTLFSFRKGDYCFVKKAVSPTLSKIVQWMNTTVNNNNTVTSLRYVGYIAHRTSLDLMLSYFEHTFNCSAVDEHVEHSSILTVDLVEDVSKNASDYYVLASYNDELLFKVSFSEFIDVINNNIVSNEEIYNYCNWQVEKLEFDNYIIYSLLLLIVFVAAFTVCVQKVIPRRHFSKKGETAPIN